VIEWATQNPGYAFLLAGLVAFITGLAVIDLVGAVQAIGTARSKARVAEAKARQVEAETRRAELGALLQPPSRADGGPVTLDKVGDA
jgi:hypothetical protein